MIVQVFEPFNFHLLLMSCSSTKLYKVRKIYVHRTLHFVKVLQVCHSQFIRFGLKILDFMDQMDQYCLILHHRVVIAILK